MTASRPDPEPSSKRREMRMGDQECPRCHETFTVSYWSNGMLIQARCLSCDLRWPLPHVV